MSISIELQPTILITYQQFGDATESLFFENSRTIQRKTMKTPLCSKYRSYPLCFSNEINNNCILISFVIAIFIFIEFESFYLYQMVAFFSPIDERY